MSNSPVFDLSGRVALVTGASSGLGERFVKLLAQSGARVALGARRKDRLDRIVREILDVGGEAIGVEMDVTDEPSTIAAYDAAELAFGGVDTIIANAGTAAEGAANELSVAEFDRVLSVNVRGVFLTIREGVKRLLAQEPGRAQRGRITIVSSITAEKVLPGLAAYSASKAAALQMGKVLARDWARYGICVNSILPGYTKTDLNGDWLDSEHGAKLISQFPRRRTMDANSLDAALLYLSSDGAGSVTGSAIVIDDGQSL